MPGGHYLLSTSYYTPALLFRSVAFVLSCLGAFLGVRCASRGRATAGSARVRWLLLGGISVGVVGIWAADFTGILSLSVPGMAVRYSVPVTIACLAAGALSVCGGMLAAGLGGPGLPRLVVAGMITGLGVAFMHYLGIAAMQLPARISYNGGLLGLSVALAVVASTAALWAAARLRGVLHTAGAAVIIGILVTGMHDAGVAAVRLSPAASPAGMIPASSGVTAPSFLLPLTMGLAIILFLVSWAVALAPTEEAIRYDETLLDHIRTAARVPLHVTPLTARGTAAKRMPASSPPWTFAELRKPPPGADDPQPRKAATATAAAAATGTVTATRRPPGPARAATPPALPRRRPPLQA